MEKAGTPAGLGPLGRGGANPAPERSRSAGTRGQAGSATTRRRMRWEPWRSSTSSGPLRGPPSPQVGKAFSLDYSKSIFGVLHGGVSSRGSAGPLSWSFLKGVPRGKIEIPLGSFFSFVTFLFLGIQKEESKPPAVVTAAPAGGGAHMRGATIFSSLPKNFTWNFSWATISLVTRWDLARVSAKSARTSSSAGTPHRRAAHSKWW